MNLIKILYFHYEILSIFIDSLEQIWLGTNGNGLFLIENDIIYTYTSDSGLTSNYIFSILEDNKENLWVSSYKGVRNILKNGLDRISRSNAVRKFPRKHENIRGAEFYN